MATPPRPRGGHKPAPRQDRENQGETLVRRHQQPEPQLPHERDESSGSQSDADDPRTRQASRDLSKGLVDTGRTPVVTELEKKHFPPETRKKAEG